MSKEKEAQYKAVIAAIDRWLGPPCSECYWAGCPECSQIVLEEI